MRTRHALTAVLLLFPLLMGSRCKDEPDPDPDKTDHTDIITPEVKLQVISIDPSQGEANQSFDASIYGSEFKSGASVSFQAANSEYKASARVVNENTMEITVPGMPEGTYSVVVVNPDMERALLRRGLTIAASSTDACEHLVVHFDYNSSELKAEAVSVLGQASSCLQHSRGTIRIEGHTDERGTTDYNIALGERRAEVVKRYLTSQGVSPARLTTVSYGEERPVARGSSESSWAQNRRSELELED